MTDEFFRTTDRLLTAFLRVRGNQLLEVRPDDNNGKATFVFRDSEKLLRDTKDFMDNAPIPVRSLARKMAQLRDACRDLRRRPTLDRTNEQTRNQ